MGFFSNIASILSGETSLKQELITNHHYRFIQESVLKKEETSENIIILVLSSYVGAMLEWALFEKNTYSEYNLFQTHRKHLTPKKTLLMYQLYAMLFLSIFTSSKGANKILKDFFSTNSRDLESEVLEYFQCGKDVKSFYKKLVKTHGNEKFFHIFHEELLGKIKFKSFSVESPWCIMQLVFQDKALVAYELFIDKLKEISDNRILYREE